MDSSNDDRTVITVLGTVPSSALGITLAHEHLFADLPLAHMQESANEYEAALANAPVSLDNLGWVRYHPMMSRDNQGTLSEELATAEALLFKQAGGGTIVELSNIGLGRNPLALSRLSQATDLHIIMGTGFYIESTMPFDMKLDAGLMADEIVRDIVTGVGDTGIRAGIIGEVGTEWPVGNFERVNLTASARAQRLTQCGINVHLGNSPQAGIEVAEILGAAGADLSRVAMSHVDNRIFDHRTRVELAKTGCYLEWDNFSSEGWYWRRMVLSEDNPIKCDMPNDATRVDQIMALIDEGYLNQILISHDLPLKHRLWKYGGSGYAHILRNVVPLMRHKGMTEEHIMTILIDNPKRFLEVRA